MKNYVVKNILIPIESNFDFSNLIASKFLINQNDVLDVKIIRKSIDARKKYNLKYNFTLFFSFAGKIKPHHDLMMYSKPIPDVVPHKFLSNHSPFIIGAGPAGLFSALSLVEKGFTPEIFEQGDSIEERTKIVQNFWETGNLDLNSNVQFGEGGAGSFSDGKLTSRGRNFYTEKILDYLIKFGAKPEIKFEALPHLGTDGLVNIIKNLRNFLIEKGVKFHWRSKLENFKISQNKLVSVTINGLSFSPEILILAVGNSARDLFQLLYDRQVMIESKPIAVGFRIEHPQTFIDEAFYGKKVDINLTGHASYRLTHKLKKRGVYSFCMCPGGSVVAATSELNSQVLNGMSYYNRDKKFANSAIVVSVNANDFGNGILDGVHFQRHIEKKCFLKNYPYYAPVESTDSFLGFDKNKKINSSYNPGVIKSNLKNIYQPQITDALKSALIKFDKRIKGFISNGLLLAPETRTSSPVRILRSRENFASLNVENLYPIGEGAGYSGGIVSSATDGYRVASIFVK